MRFYKLCIYDIILIGFLGLRICVFVKVESMGNIFECFMVVRKYW